MAVDEQRDGRMHGFYRMPTRRKEMGTSYLGRGMARFAVVAIQKAGQAGQRPTRWKMSPSVGGVVTWYA
jgi:hypothetical protein